MIELRIEIEGLQEILNKMQRFPQQLKNQTRRVMDASLRVVQESVPPYPPPPATSTYRRTGTLGRSLGAGGKPDIYRISGSGTYITGEFGTRVKYAPYVVGERQAWMHKGRWWRVPVEVLNRARPKIEQLWQELAEDLARFLDGKGL